MKTQVLANDEVHLFFRPTEHIALARSLYFLLAELETDQMLSLLGSSGDEAYEFAYGVYLSECAARTTGVSWLGDGRVTDELAARRTPSVNITYTEFGSEWRISPRELALVQACASEVAHRAAS